MVPGSTYAKFHAFLLNGKYRMNFFRVLRLVFFIIKHKIKQNKKFRWLHILLCLYRPWQSMYQISCFYIEWKVSNEFFVFFFGVFFMIKHKIHKITKIVWLHIQFGFYGTWQYICQFSCFYLEWEAHN